MDPKRLVANGYDCLYRAYEAWGGGHVGLRHRYIDRAFDLGLRLPGTALDLGCGTGRHATAYLVERGLEVVGVDASAESINAARVAIPNAVFVVGDMTALEIPPASFDLITALFSIIHVPRSEHRRLFQQIGEWLRPGGLLVAALGGGSGQSAGVDERWLEVAPMYWSFWDPATSGKLISEAGLDVVEDEEEVLVEDGHDVRFWWVVARKP